MYAPRVQSYSLDLARVNLDDSDAGSDKFFPQGVREASDGGLCCTVDASSRVSFPSGNAPDVDDISPSSVFSLFENRQNCLRHVDEPGDVGVYHGVDIFCENIWCLCNTFDEASDKPKVIQLAYIINLRPKK